MGGPLLPGCQGDTILGFGKDHSWASQVALLVENLPVSAGDIRVVGSIPGSGGSAGGGHSKFSSVQSLSHVGLFATHSSILAWRIPKDRGAWWATVYRVAQSDTTEVT